MNIVSEAVLAGSVMESEWPWAEDISCLQKNLRGLDPDTELIIDPSISHTFQARVLEADAS